MLPRKQKGRTVELKKHRMMLREKKQLALTVGKSLYEEKKCSTKMSQEKFEPNNFFLKKYENIKIGGSNFFKSSLGFSCYFTKTINKFNTEQTLTQ